VNVDHAAVPRKAGRAFSIVDRRTTFMNRNTTIGDALKYLDQNIERFRSARFMLEALIHGPDDPGKPPTPPASAVNAAVRVRTGLSVANAAIDILRAANRPMHALAEIVPALQAAGYKVHPHGLATTLLRTGQVVRVARGTFALREHGERDFAA
jgi:hypothetical protein